MRASMSLAAAVCVVVSVSAQGQTTPAGGAQTAPAASAAAPAAKPDACEAMQKKLDDWPQLGRYAAENAALTADQPGRVVFYGDSITDAWGRRPDTGEFFPGKPYVNRGISGQTTEQMVVRFRQDVIDLHPEAVVILAGTNDIAGNTGPETPETIEDDFRSMVDLARANHIRVILASITPADHYPWKPSAGDPANEIRQINEWMKGYCEENHITYLDYWDAMAGPTGGMKPGISKDGVHPNTKGYAIMAPLAEAALSGS